MRRGPNTVETINRSFDGLSSDYSAAKRSRFRRARSGAAPLGSHADYHYRSEGDFLRIMEEARDMDRNDDVSFVVDRAVQNVIQNGLTVDPSTGDAEVDAALKARWGAWASDPDACDVAGECTFADMQSLAFRHQLVDGDFGALGTVDGGLQLIEAHRIRTPRGTKRNVVHGVLLSPERRRLEYWVTREDVGLRGRVDKVSDIQAYPTRDADGLRVFFHVYEPKRASQTRGVSAFAPIFDTAGMFEDINFAHLVKQQVVSCFAIFREREDDGFSAPAATGEQSTDVLADGSTRTLEGLAPGMTLTGAPGEKFHGFSPNIPSQEFFQHVRLMLQLISLNLGLPLVVAMMDASETNFSGWRGAVDQAKIGWRRSQRTMVSKFCAPVYRWKLAQFAVEDAALERAAARLGDAFYLHRWNPPTWPYVEPLKDASADALLLRAGLNSPRRVQAERGRDWDEIVTEIVEDNAQAITAAKHAARTINATFASDGDPVHWRELISLPLAEGVQVSLQSAGNQGDDSDA